METPNLKPRVMELELDYVNKLLGVGFSASEVKKLLKKMRYDVKADGKKFRVYVPSYRTDVLHPIDLVEDVAIAYGYDKFEPENLRIQTYPKRDGLEEFSNVIRKLMVGSGFWEVKTLIMTNKNVLFNKMHLSEETSTETDSPVSSEHSVCRTWLLPSLLSVLEKNRNQEYPQKVFEVGDCVTGGGKDERKVSGVVAHSATNFSEIKSIVMGISESIGAKYQLKPHSHKSFILGRCAQTGFGFFGEIHPVVLGNFGLEVPVTAFELNLEKFLG